MLLMKYKKADATLNVVMQLLIRLEISVSLH